MLITPAHWGKQRPAAGSRVNSGHPLAQGLWACYLFNEGAGNPRDLCGRAHLEQVSATRPTWGPNLQTNGIRVAGDQRWFATAATTSITLANHRGVSVMYRGYVVDPTTNNRRIVQKGADGDDFRLLFESGLKFAVGGETQFVAVDTSMHSKVVQIIGTGGVGTGAGGWMRIFVDAVLKKENNWADQLATPTTNAMYVGTKNAAAPSGDSFDGTFEALYVWSRVLTVSEVRWLQAEPYAFINPPGSELGRYSVAVAAAAGALRMPPVVVRQALHRSSVI